MSCVRNWKKSSSGESTDHRPATRSWTWWCGPSWSWKTSTTRRESCPTGWRLSSPTAGIIPPLQKSNKLTTTATCSLLCRLIMCSLQWVFKRHLLRWGDFLYRTLWNVTATLLSVLINIVMLWMWKAKLSLGKFDHENVDELPSELFEWVEKYQMSAVCDGYYGADFES